MKKSIFFTIFLICLLFCTLIIYIKTDVYQVAFVVDNELYKTVNVRKNTSLKKIDSPEKDEHVFIGWYDEDNNRLDEKTIIQKDSVYYAKWGVVITNEENTK